MKCKFNKVFCVGALKTGTSSFGMAMQQLGFRHCGWDEYVWHELYLKGRIDKLIQFAQGYDSFNDLPWSKLDMLPRLDESYPNSGFVILEREYEAWFKSFFRHVQETDYSGEIKKEVEISAFKKRNREIRDYFSGEKKSQLLVMNITAGEGYELLCPFLGLPVANKSFPCENRTLWNANDSQ